MERIPDLTRQVNKKCHNTTRDAFYTSRAAYVAAFYISFSEEGMK